MQTTNDTSNFNRKTIEFTDFKYHSIQQFRVSITKKYLRLFLHSKFVLFLSFISKIKTNEKQKFDINHRNRRRYAWLKLLCNRFFDWIRLWHFSKIENKQISTGYCVLHSHTECKLAATSALELSFAHSFIHSFILIII